jgi:hypothetical protein
VKKRLVLASTLPGLVAGYFLLAGYILNKVRPIPITAFPEPKSLDPLPAVPPMYRRPAEASAEPPASPIPA